MKRISRKNQLWASHFLFLSAKPIQNQAKLKEFIGEDFITISPGEEHWQNRDEFIVGAKAFADHQGRLVSLSFPRTHIQSFGDVAVLYSLVQITMESRGETGISKPSLYGGVFSGAVDGGSTLGRTSTQDGNDRGEAGFVSAA